MWPDIYKTKLLFGLNDEASGMTASFIDGNHTTMIRLKIIMTR